MSDNKAPGAQNDAANILATPPQTSARNTSKDTGDDLEPARKASTESTINSSTMIPDINSVRNSSFLPERPAYIPIPAIAPHSSPATTRVASASAPYPIEKPAKFLSSTAVPREHAISPTSVAAAAASVISYIAGKEASPISARDVDIVGETEASATKGRSKKKPNELQNTWDNKSWNEAALPGPRPEWKYTLPKEEPKMSRVYRRKEDQQDPDGTERLVFVNQDDAPYTAMGTSWAQDDEQQARFIWKRAQEGHMIQAQDEAAKKDHLESQKYQNSRNVSSKQQKRDSIIGKMFEATRDKVNTPRNFARTIAIDEATADWLFGSIDTVFDTIEYYTNTTNHQLRNLLKQMVTFFRGLWALGNSGLSHALEGIGSIKWWLLAALIVFLVAFGLMNDSMPPLGLHQYHIPTTYSPTSTVRHLKTKAALVPAVSMAAGSSIKNVWTYVSTMSMPSSIPGVRDICQFMASIVSQLWVWLRAFAIFCINNRFSTFITDIRVVVAIICVVVTLGLIHFHSARLRGIADWLYNNARVVGQHVNFLAHSLATYAIAAIERAYVILQNKLDLIRRSIIDNAKLFKSALIDRAGKSRELILNLPYILIWCLSNPVISIRSLFGYSLVWGVGWSMRLTALLTSCVYWPIVQSLALLNGTLETASILSRYARERVLDLHTTLRTQVGTWYRQCEGWSVGPTLAAWTACFTKWTVVLVMYTAMIFALGLGWRDIYEGFEKVVIEVAPC